MNEPNHEKNLFNHDDHIIKMWTPFDLKIDEGYHFVPKNILVRAARVLFRSFVLFFLNIYCRFLFGFRVTGRENLKKISHGAVTVCNHVNMLDCVMVAQAIGSRELYFLTLKSNFEIPLVRRLIKILGGVPIPETTSAFEALCVSIRQALDQGSIVHVYPEAVLHPYYMGLRRFKRGAFKFAYDNDVPVVPLVLSYREPTGIRKWFKRRPFLSLSILDPIYPERGENHRTAISHMIDRCHAVMEQEFHRATNV